MGEESFAFFAVRAWLNENDDFDRICRRCRYNPTAMPPYVKMRQVQATELTKTKLYKYAKRHKLRIDCVFCRAVRQLGFKERMQLILNDERFSTDAAKHELTKFRKNRAKLQKRLE